MVSNGEFVPPPQTATARWIERATLAEASDAADRLGLDRRRFLQGVGGLAVMLSMVNLACAGSSPPGAKGGPASTGVGGTFNVPEPTDLAACHQAFAPVGQEFIIDVHTHHVMPQGPWRQTSPTAVDIIRPLIPPGCTEADPFVCVDRIAYVEDLLLGSDTAVAILSDVPNSGPDNAPLPFGDNVGTHEFAASLSRGGQSRVLVQSIIAPNFGDLSSRLDGMTQQADQAKLSSFKTYTAWGPGGVGYQLDQDIGLRVIDHARSLGVRTICAHKGLRLEGLNEAFNHPRDLVAAAVQFPDVNFVVYHSAFDSDSTEGPYDPANAGVGINSLLKALNDYHVGPNSNVWCELGTTWRTVMSSPTEAAHALGKLLVRVGEDRVMWGTDAIWYGSPQPQIMAFRAFEITPAFQTRYGYPALTDDLKRKVFGINASNLLGLDLTTAVCAINTDDLDKAKAAYTSLRVDGDVPQPWAARAPVTRREVLHWLTSRAGPL